jgi:hypothetical protein
VQPLLQPLQPLLQSPPLQPLLRPNVTLWGYAFRFAYTVEYWKPSS